jgi:hypothetical protein
MLLEVMRPEESVERDIEVVLPIELVIPDRAFEAVAERLSMGGFREPSKN